MQAINLVHKFSLFTEHWKPKIIAEVNDNHVKLVKLKGEFIWHKHDNEDELFLVVKGKLIIQLCDGQLVLHEGELAVIPKGVEHRPVAGEETQVLLLEPKSTLNTGDQRNEHTATPEWI